MSTRTDDLDVEYNAFPISLHDFSVMQELFKSAFNLELKYQTFIERFNTGLLGIEVIGYIATHKQSNEAAAYYGVFPVKLLINNETAFGAQSGDTMTHVNHRKKGLFLWLARKTLDKCRDNGISMAFGSPNNNSYHGLVNSLNWLHLDNTNSYDLKLKVKTIPLAKLALKFGIFKYYLKIAKRFLKPYIVETPHQFVNPLIEHPRVSRDANYLQYKRAADKVFIKINTVTAWVKFSDVLWIGDFDNYNNVDQTTINELKRIARLLGYNTIRFNFTESLPQPRFLKFFKKAGKEPSCFFYFRENLKNTNLLLTAADFDTW